MEDALRTFMDAFGGGGGGESIFESLFGFGGGRGDVPQVPVKEQVKRQPFVFLLKKLPVV